VCVWVGVVRVCVCVTVLTVRLNRCVLSFICEIFPKNFQRFFIHSWL